MLVNLTDIFISEGKTVEHQIQLERDSFQTKAGNFQVVEKSPVNLQLSNIGPGKVLITGSAKLVLLMSCDRCLTEVRQQFLLEFSREVLAPSGEFLKDEEDEQSFLVEDYYLDVESLIGCEVLINWPMKVLCREECKGFCMSCGKNLNEGSCACDTFVPDPRMAKIKDIFNANKEV